jgi:hypothetical protein
MMNDEPTLVNDHIPMPDVLGIGVDFFCIRIRGLCLFAASHPTHRRSRILESMAVVVLFSYFNFSPPLLLRCVHL